MLDIQYEFIEQVKDYLTEYEDQNMNIFFSVFTYGKFFAIYSYNYVNNKITSDDYYQDYFDYFSKLYQQNDISLDKFVYYININDDKELAIKLVNRLKQFYPHINYDMSSHDVGWYMEYDSYKLNNNCCIYFILV